MATGARCRAEATQELPARRFLRLRWRRRVLTAALIAAAVLAGVAGSWSPCGLSMVETLERARWAVLAFAAGALAGGAVTFGGLAWLGDTLGAGGGLAAAVAIAALLAGSLGDAAG